MCAVWVLGVQLNQLVVILYMFIFILLNLKKFSDIKKKNEKELLGTIAGSFAHPTGIQEVVGSILLSGNIPLWR